MTDDIEERIARGKRANALLNDPLLAEAFSGVVKSYYDDWLKTQPDAVADREKIYLKARQMGEVRQRLLSVVDDGTVAQHEAEQDQK